MPIVSFTDTPGNNGLNPALSWRNPPANWQNHPSGSRLWMEPDPKTDFWQRTHYGFQMSNGHLLKTEIGHNASISSQIQIHPRHQYDQAGLMVWFSDDFWLKTAVEFEIEGASQLGAVVTNGGFSDWSMQDYSSPGKSFSYHLQIRRRNGDFFIEYRAAATDSWKLIRVAHLAPNGGVPCSAGVYACSPQEGGCHVEFESFVLETD